MFLHKLQWSCDVSLWSCDRQVFRATSYLGLLGTVLLARDEPRELATEEGRELVLELARLLGSEPRGDMISAYMRYYIE